MKKCKNCVEIPVCDFCRYFEFNKVDSDKSICKKHDKILPPEMDACDDFHCVLRLTLIDKIRNIWLN